jgi:hypothetical protein
VVEQDTYWTFCILPFEGQIYYVTSLGPRSKNVDTAKEDSPADVITFLSTVIRYRHSGSDADLDEAVVTAIEAAWITHGAKPKPPIIYISPTP